MKLPVALFALLFPFFAHAQVGLPFPGPGHASSGAANPVVAYKGTATATVSSTTATTTGQTIGATGLNVIIVYDAFVNNSTTTLTVNGVSATLIADMDQGATNAHMFSIPATGATTATIVATASGTWGSPFFDVENITGLSSNTPVGSNQNQNNSNTISTTVATSSGGAIIVGASQISTGATSGTLTGTETYTVDHSSFATGSNSLTGHASNVAANASSTVTATFLTNSNQNVIVASSFR